MTALPPLLAAYLGFSRLAGPIYRQLHKTRLKTGKEEPTRLPERYGKGAVARPDGRLVWFHAASVGETRSILGLIDQLLQTAPDLHVLVTSNTVTSAHMLVQELPNRAMHHYAPIDTTAAARAFLDHWQPDVAIWVESELWPRILRESKRRAIPMMLLSARISTKTARLWRKWPRTLRAILAPFDHILSQTEDTAQLIRDICGANVPVTVSGSLKQELPAPPVDADVLAQLQSQIGTRPIWAAASTHPGEDEIIVAAHQELAKSQEHPLMILIPRHPNRGPELAQGLRSKGHVVARRSADEPLEPATEIYIADTLGDMGLWYRLCPVSFVAGSLLPIGGHNPYEPIILNSAVVHGAHVFNFKDVYADLKQAGGSIMAETAADIAKALEHLLTADAAKDQATKARTALETGNNATETSLSAILTLLNAGPKP